MRPFTPVLRSREPPTGVGSGLPGGLQKGYLPKLDFCYTAFQEPACRSVPPAVLYVTLRRESTWE
jgi:hypothetical protein